MQSKPQKLLLLKSSHVLIPTWPRSSKQERDFKLIDSQFFCFFFSSLSNYESWASDFCSCLTWYLQLRFLISYPNKRECEGNGEGCHFSIGAGEVDDDKFLKRLNTLSKFFFPVWAIQIVPVVSWFRFFNQERLICILSRLICEKQCSNESVRCSPVSIFWWNKLLNGGIWKCMLKMRKISSWVHYCTLKYYCFLWESSRCNGEPWFSGHRIFQNQYLKETHEN